MVKESLNKPTDVITAEAGIQQSTVSKPLDSGSPPCDARDEPLFSVSLLIKHVGVLITGLLCSSVAMGQGADFSQCMAGLQDKARAEHLPAWIVDEVMVKLEPQPRVIELDRAQPEFTQTFADYLNRRITPERIEQGRHLQREYARFLAEMTAHYGVPGRYLLAFWGQETNFGGYLGTMPTLDSLATLACDERRSGYFADEFITALSLLDREGLSPQEMRGSWAGAVGQTQFMPSAYRKYAVDGDHDGHINLWKSERDALASAANYVTNLGWHSGERWGREVLLPAKFPYVESGLDNRRPIRYWAGLGVKLTDKTQLPDTDMAGSILLPAGHAGPAFLVYHNFDVIMKWNRSEYYALTIGLFADRLAGAGELARPPSISETALSRDTVMRMQDRLNHLGFTVGEADGIIGSATRAALRAFQKSAGIIADGYPDSATLGALAVGAGPKS
jgi:membrane-bound lytic murein transglycosylase B